MPKPIEEWTFEDAIRAQDKWDASDRQNSIDEGRSLTDNVRGPLFQWIGAQELKELRAAYNQGRKEAILEVVYTCSLNSLPLPEWFEIAFIKAYRQVKQYRAKSWDDVFGKAHKKGTHLATKRQERTKSLAVYRRVREIKQAEPLTPTDERLFDRVGRETGLGGATVMSEYYYSWKNKLETK
jgi:hypothetical protein